jgi:hypothetical protein
MRLFVYRNLRDRPQRRSSAWEKNATTWRSQARGCASISLTCLACDLQAGPEGLGRWRSLMEVAFAVDVVPGAVIGPARIVDPVTPGASAERPCIALVSERTPAVVGQPRRAGRSGVRVAPAARVIQMQLTDCKPDGQRLVRLAPPSSSA